MVNDNVLTKEAMNQPVVTGTIVNGNVGIGGVNVIQGFSAEHNGLKGEAQATVGAAVAADAVPTTPTCYLVAQGGGADHVLLYYNKG
jgi:hypothetical protein